MRKSICLSVALVLSCCVPCVAADLVSTEVAGTMVIGPEVASIKGSTVEIRLYGYQLKDSAATLVDKVQIKNFAHKKGKETKTPFSIGQKPGRKVNPQMQYYVTLFIHSGDPAKTPRTHMGEAQHRKGLCTVLTGGNPREIVMKVRAVGGAVKVRPRPLPGGPKPAANNDDFKTIQRAQLVFTAELKQALAGPVARSMPPIYNHKLVLVVKDVLRGDLKPGDKLTINHSARQRVRPTFPVGKVCLVTAARSQGSIRAGLVRKADDDLLKTARTATSMPLGWSKKKDKFVSPWADLGADAWPKKAPPVAGAAVCSVTGRPALLVGADVSMKVEKVPPARQIKWSNPDGDGKYTITITNDTPKPVTIPALLSDDKGILWNESLVILCQDKARPVPGAKLLKTAPKPTVLKPRQAVSTVVNAFCLTNVKWPRGGYRIEFQFCLGELSVTKSFYYLSRHHDPIRQAANAKPKN